MTETTSTQSNRADGASPEARHSAYSALRRSGVIVLTILVVAVIAGFVVTQLTTASYSTETKVLLRPQTTGEGVTVTDASTLVSGQVQTYAALATTPSVLDPAIRSSGVDTDSATLVDDVTASPVPDTAIIVIDVNASNARDAASLANAIAGSLIDQVSAQSTVGGQAFITGVVVEAPLIPTDPDSPNLLVNLLVAAAIGLAVSGVVVALREASARGRLAPQ